MSKSIAEKISDWCCKEGGKRVEEYSVILYGLEVVIENIVKTIILISIGIFFCRLKEAFIIVFSFCVVRIYAGGIHAKYSLGCTAFMVGVEMVGLIFDQFIEISGIYYVILGVLSNILIGMYAPNGSRSCDLLEETVKRKKKRYALCTANILFLLAFL